MHQRGYSIGAIFKGLTSTFDDVLDDLNRGEDGKVAIKSGAVEGMKKMGKKSINRAPGRKTISRKQKVKRSRPTTSKK